ncbi:MAG TPA: hypothetical protein VNU46_01970 [Gemmatimonadaceae bacterium]|nr:hypothetical protein [Gemmatimonadaceae bacterium]
MMSEPLYATPDAGNQANRRLLLISYHFPPDPSVGARRWEKLAHYVAERGWGVDVITRREQPFTSPSDLARLKTLPSGVRIYGVPLPTLALQRVEHAAWSLLRGRRKTATKAVPAQGHAKTGGGTNNGTATSLSSPREKIRWSLHTPRGYLRAYWAWLDFAQYGEWGTQVERVARAIVHPKVHLAVVSSGPPHMSHDAGRRVSKRTGLPFVMDMRDPWRNVERLSEGTSSPLWLHMAARYERRAVEQATLVVANTELARRALQEAYPARRNDIITAMNGADADPLPPRRRGENGQGKDRFVIGHAGTIYLDRDPRALFQAAARVVRELALTPEQFTLEFIGELEAVGGFPIREVAQQEGIDEYVRTGPPRPHAEAMQFMADATMLVTMSGTNATAIPAKTFECIRFDSWILALSAPGSATELLLQGTEADVAPPGDVERITDVIRKRYQQHAAGVAPVRIAADGDDRFSRCGQAKLLFDAITSRVVQS